MPLQESIVRNVLGTLDIPGEDPQARVPLPRRARFLASKCNAVEYTYRT